MAGCSRRSSYLPTLSDSDPLCTTPCCPPAPTPRLADLSTAALPAACCPPLLCPLPAAPRRLTCLRLPHTKERSASATSTGVSTTSTQRLSFVAACSPPKPRQEPSSARPSPCQQLQTPPSPLSTTPASRWVGRQGTAADQISAPGAEPAPVPPRIVVSHRAVPPRALFQKSSVHRASRLVKLDFKHQPQLTRRYRRLSQQP